jgi:flagellar hook-associated protein 2
MEDDIADWDVRLEQRRTMLERQYGALEVALGKMQNQASWLAGQINSLPKMMGS